MDWNPHVPATLGMEWFPSVQGQHTIDSSIKGYAVSLDQTVSETIDRLHLHVQSLPVRGGLYVIEAYDEENLEPQNLLTADARPNEDIGIGNWRTFTGGTVNLWSHMDEGPDPNPNDGIHLPSNNLFPTSYIGRFNTGSFISLTGKRILSVGLHLYMVSGSGSYWTAGLRIDGTDYMGLSAHGPAGPEYRTFEWKYNPATRRPWRIADVLDFDTTDGWIIAGITQNLWVAIFAMQAFLRVTYCDENRLAWGVLDDSASGLVQGGNNEVSFLTPTGGNWTKDASGRHTYMVRRLNSQGKMTIPYLNSALAPPAAHGLPVTLDPTLGFATEASLPYQWVFPVKPRRTDGAFSVDAQPYAQLTAARVIAGQDAEGEFEGAVGDYGLISFLARTGGLAPGALGSPEVLTIKLRRRSDDVQLGSTHTLAEAELADHPEVAGGWRRVTVQLVTPGTLTAVQHYIEFSSLVTGVDGDYWEVAAAESVSVNGNNAGFGGTVDRATLNGAEADGADLAATVATIPVAPAGFTATAMTEDLADESVCCATAIHFARVAWTPTALGGTFAYYEIQRSEDSGATWETVARVYTETVDAWDDWEGRRGLPVQYQMRLVRTDSAISPWTAAQTATKPINDTAMYFTSNYAPDLVRGVYDRDPEAEYDDHDAGVMTHHPIYGRDRQRAYQPAEVLGATGSWTLLVGIDDRTPAGGGKALDAFVPLQAIAKAHVPYVTVLDHDGTRLYASLRTPTKSYRNPLGQYYAPVLATEIATVPYAVDII